MNSAVEVNLEGLQFNDAGLIPVITQDAKTKNVLMLAWMNKETILQTLKTKRATYWSRSRNEVWVKGETSGAIQEVVSLAIDCDSDALLLTVNQIDGACHTGDLTCFDAKVIVAGDTK